MDTRDLLSTKPATALLFGDSDHFRSAFEKHHIVHGGNSELFGDVLTYSQIDQLLDRKDQLWPSYRLLKDGNYIDESLYVDIITLPDAITYPIINPERVATLYSTGHTVVFAMLQECFSGVSRLCNALSAELGCQIKVKGYLTPPNSVGVAPHWDARDVIVLQLFGSKRWRLFNSPFYLPYEGDYNDLSDVKYHAIDEFDLSAGSSLYVPRGFIHQVFTTDDPSFHITLTLNHRRWIDIVRESLHMVEQLPEFRRTFAKFNGASKEASMELFATFMNHVDLK